MRLKEEEGEGKESSTSLCSLLEEICLGRMREKERTESESLLPSLDGVEDILRYKFNNRSLLEEAFIHPSYHYPEKPCVSYERLEYVGDSVLNLLMAKELFLLYPDLSPGPLTKLRAANVDNEKLARVAIKHGFHRYIRHKSPSLEEQVKILPPVTLSSSRFVSLVFFSNLI
uniref:RNase III domain-containing protein n=1 Tax=Nelumbo nucifera TaxID=4432 RepID=A0A822XJ26_NELNU|nr:TPA_asm: hypothetical protein HUJ06_021873 [Nelumbo nucifera]